MKRCYVCGVEKPFQEFNPSKKKPDGLQAKCRVCQAEYAARWYVANRDKVLQDTSRWQKKNPAKKRAIQKRYRDKKK